MGGSAGSRAGGATGREAEHGRRVSAMFGRIARFYDLLNHSLSMGQDYYWRRRLVRLVRPVPDGVVLDLAAGTLDVAVELTRQYPGLRVMALDFTHEMLAQGARAKLSGALFARIAPVQADGRSLPLPDASMDGATIAFGIRNILPRQAAYAEFLRVLKPGARLCILEFGTGSRPVLKGLYNFYLDKLLPMIGNTVSGDSEAYRYLADTIKKFPDEHALAAELSEAGFERVLHVPMAFGIVQVHVAQKPMKAAAGPKTAAKPARRGRASAGNGRAK